MISRKKVDSIAIPCLNCPLQLYDSALIWLGHVQRGCVGTMHGSFKVIAGVDSRSTLNRCILAKRERERDLTETEATQWNHHSWRSAARFVEMLGARYTGEELAVD